MIHDGKLFMMEKLTNKKNKKTNGRAGTHRVDAALDGEEMRGDQRGGEERSLGGGLFIHAVHF